MSHESHDTCSVVHFWPLSLTIFKSLRFLVKYWCARGIQTFLKYLVYIIRIGIRKACSLDTLPRVRGSLYGLLVAFGRKAEEIDQKLLRNEQFRPSRVCIYVVRSSLFFHFKVAKQWYINYPLVPVTNFVSKNRK